jgi:hypothetical protein
MKKTKEMKEMKNIEEQEMARNLGPVLRRLFHGQYPHKRSALEYFLPVRLEGFLKLRRSQDFPLSGNG